MEPEAAGRPPVRIEHRDGTAVHVLGRAADEFRAVVARLTRRKARGEVVLVEEATGAVVVRALLDAPTGRP